MKLNKKTSVISWFLAGAMLFGTAAAADVIIGDGYNGAKQALKYTTKTLAKNTDSFTAQVGFEVKIDGSVCASETTTNKMDFKNQKSESTGESFSAGGDSYSSYNYSDTEKTISKYGHDEKYYQYNHEKDVESSVNFDDPFEEDMANDVEKVADAFVSNMKDFIQVANSDGDGKVYYGNLDSSQIPAFANAVSSLFVKYSFLEDYNRERYNIPEIKENLYFTEVSGKISQNSDGLLDSAVGKAVVVGTDKDGNEHEFEFSLNFSLTDINETTISEPNISPDEIEIGEDRGSDYIISTKDIGTFKSDVVKSESNAYVKVGERILTITAVDGNTVTGHLTITDDNGVLDTDITAECNPDNGSSNFYFEYTDINGEQKNGILSKYCGFSGYTGNIDVYIGLSEIDREKDSWGYSGDDANNFTAVRVFE